MTLPANATEQGEKPFAARLRSWKDYLHRRHVLLIFYGLVLATFPLLTTFWHRNLFYLTFLPVFLLTIDTGFVRQTARNWGFQLACAFIAVAWLSQFYSPDLDLKVLFNATRKCLLVTVFLVATIQLSARYERFLPGVAIGLLIGCVVMAVFMIGEAVSLDRWPPPRLEGFGRGENSILAAVLFGIALITALDILRSPDWKRYWRMAAAGAAIPLIAATLLTHSRGPWVALYATLIVLLLAERRWSLLLGVGAATAAGAIMVIADIVDGGSIISRMDSQRLVLWSQTWEWIVENPILGAGYNADLGLVGDDGIPYKAPHSLYISVLAFFGLAGTIPFFGMLGYCLRRMVLDLTQEICSMSTLLLIFGLVNGAFHGYVPINNLNVEWLVLWLPIGFEIGCAQREKSAQTDT